jgi:hypothetical protein
VANIIDCYGPFIKIQAADTAMVRNSTAFYTATDMAS